MLFQTDTTFTAVHFQLFAHGLRCLGVLSVAIQVTTTQACSPRAVKRSVGLKRSLAATGHAGGGSTAADHTLTGIDVMKGACASWGVEGGGGGGADGQEVDGSCGGG